MSASLSLNAPASQATRGRKRRRDDPQLDNAAYLSSRPRLRVVCQPVPTSPADPDNLRHPLGFSYVYRPSVL